MSQIPAQLSWTAGLRCTGRRDLGIACRCASKGVRILEVLNLPPEAPSLMEASRAIGYSLETAIADIIDNSLSAGASKIDILYPPAPSPCIAILDDGIGMERTELVQAMRFGSRSPTAPRRPGDLGRFGLGLKTASLSQGRQLTVASKAQSGIAAAQWDLDLVEETGAWSLQILDEHDMALAPEFERLRQLDSGTLVVWRKLDRVDLSAADPSASLAHHMNRVMRHVGLVFHRYLEGEPGHAPVHIALNNIEVPPRDPFLAAKSTQASADEQVEVDGHAMTVRPYILPHSSKLSRSDIDSLGGLDALRQGQGFYVYRNRRLLTWGSWFHLAAKDETSKLARVRVDVPNALDHLWALDIKKSSASPPAIIRQGLQLVIDGVRVKSRRTWEFRGKRETDPSVVRMWTRLQARDGQVLYEINAEHPLIKMLAALPDPAPRLAAILVRQIPRLLPWNQLVVDMHRLAGLDTSREAHAEPPEEVVSAWIQLMSQAQGADREALRTVLGSAEPYCLYPEWVQSQSREMSMP